MKSISIIHGFLLQDDDTGTMFQLCFSANVRMLDSSTLRLTFQPNQQIVCAQNSTNTHTHTQHRHNLCRLRENESWNSKLCFQKGRGILKMFRQFRAEGKKSCRSKSAEWTKMVCAESVNISLDDTEATCTYI